MSVHMFTRIYLHMVCRSLTHGCVFMCGLCGGGHDAYLEVVVDHQWLSSVLIHVVASLCCCQHSHRQHVLHYAHRSCLASTFALLSKSALLLMCVLLSASVLCAACVLLLTYVLMATTTQMLTKAVDICTVQHMYCC